LIFWEGMLSGIVESVKSFFNEIRDLQTSEKIALIGAFVIGLLLGYEASRGFSDMVIAITNLTKRKVRNGGGNGG